MRIPPWLLLTALCLASCSSSSPSVPEPRFDYELNAATDAKFLDTRFRVYGPDRANGIVHEGSGYRFQLPGTPQGVTESQTGLYSLFALAGDFEISTNFELIAVAPPDEKSNSYGVTCGIAIDTEMKYGNVSLARGYQKGKVNGFIISEGKPGEAGMQYKSTPYPSNAQSGILTLKREKKDLFCLVAYAPGAELVELCKVPFTDATIRKVRIFADTGGSSAPMDARISNLKIQAEEITGGLPKRERGTGWQWWHTTGVLIVLFGGVIGALLYRRHREEAG